MFKSVLALTKGSPPARRAIERAVRFARERKSRVIGLWIVPSWQPNLYASASDLPKGFTPPNQLTANFSKTVTRRLGAIKQAAKAAGVKCRCKWVPGNFPYLEIINAARRSGCDLLGSQTSLGLAYRTTRVMVRR